MTESAQRPADLVANWSEYWASGAEESCFHAGAPLNNADFWKIEFDRLPVGARVLDLCCGAGSVVKSAMARDKKFAVTGVDFARQLPRIPGATLLSGVDITALPFDDASFDAVVSQYGFEYAPTEGAAAEAARVLAPGGALIFLTHADESPPIRAARDRIARAAPMLAPDGVISTVVRLGQAALRAEPTQALETKIARLLKDAAEKSHDETTLWAHRFVAEIFAKRAQFPPDYLAKNAGMVAKTVGSYCARLEAMSAAALSQDAVSALSEQLRRLGLEKSTIEKARSGDDQIGWIIKACLKPA